MVGAVVGQRNIDAIQLMRNGWQIYVKTETDRALLMSTGLEIAGKSIDLQAPIQDPNFTQNVKIILQDLPLNEVTNNRVLLALKSIEGIDVQSQVRYSNIYINGQWTHLQNGDHFIYVTETSIPHLAGSFLVDDFMARIVKPTLYSRCSHCQQVGHKANSPDYPARVPPEVTDSIQAFCGSADPLSNLHVCPEGCTWTTADTKYDSVEKEFQHNKVQSHSLAHEANTMLSLPTPRDIMYRARDLVPQICEQWENQEIMVMEICY